MPDPGLLLPLAHVGHWTVWLLYLVPVIAVLIAVFVSHSRAKRAEADLDAGEPPAASPPHGDGAGGT